MYLKAFRHDIIIIISRLFYFPDIMFLRVNIIS